MTCRDSPRSAESFGDLAGTSGSAAGELPPPLLGFLGGFRRVATEQQSFAAMGLGMRDSCRTGRREAG
jgi:hypothetical protein